MKCHKCGGPRGAIDEGAYLNEFGRICEDCWQEEKQNLEEDHPDAYRRTQK
jgi:hypothetical protein